MGLLSSLFGAAASSYAKKNAPREVTIPFDSNWSDAWEQLRIDEESRPGNLTVSVSFDEELLKEICQSIENHQASPRILYDEEQQPINNVGESYRQEQIAAFCGDKSGEDLGWMAGFLMPEMANPHDKTAVAIYVIKQKEGSEKGLEILHGGYMDRESAKKVHKKILNLMGKDQFIPLLTRIQGGTSDKQNYGVFAYAKTKAIKFP